MVRVYDMMKTKKKGIRARSQPFLMLDGLSVMKSVHPSVLAFNFIIKPFGPAKLLTA